MKLDKIKFARLIAWIAPQIEYRESFNVVELDDLIDINVEPVALPINLSAVDGLMACMAGGTQKIEAIKYYRSLTGFGLKESKDAVEKYWVAKKDEGATLGDILGKATTRNPPVNFGSMTSQIIHFNEGDVKVEQHYAREWTAHEVDDYDYDSPMGYGSTMLEAIADLNEKLKDV